MTIPSGWTALEWSAYKRTVPLSTEWYLSATIMDLSHKHIAQLPMVHTSAQVDIDTSADVVRSLSMEAADVDKTLSAYFDPEVAPKRLIQVNHGTWVPELNRTLWLPVFTGRPSTPGSDGTTHSLIALGKECLHLRGVPPATIKSGTYVVDAIRSGLQATGERHIDIPSNKVIKARVLRDTPIGGSDESHQPWKVWTRLARSAGSQLYTDRAGTFVMRKLPTKDQITFEWDERSILTPMRGETDMTKLKTRWHGFGLNTLYADISASGAYSPTEMAINGVPWTDTEFAAQDNSLNTGAKLAARGTARLNELLTLAEQVEVDVIPFHAVEPLEYYRATTPDKSIVFCLKQASIALVGEAAGDGQGWPMAIGTNRKVRRGKPRRALIHGSARAKKGT